MTVGIRVLAVEDDERIRASVKLALEDEGWIVDEAASGEDAIAIFSKHPADVVLIDIMLPGIDGFELCRNIRKSSDVPIVMVTARADTHDVVAGLEAGADQQNLSDGAEIKMTQSAVVLESLISQFLYRSAEQAGASEKR